MARYYDTGSYEQFLRSRAPVFGVDPNVAVKVWRSEGGNGDIWQSNVTKNGRREPSYGPWQFLVGGGNTGFPEGMGNQFIRETGLSPSDPSNLNAMTDFALKQASQKGWGQWYGAAKAGVGNYDGIGGKKAPETTAVASVAPVVGGMAPSVPQTPMTAAAAPITPPPPMPTEKPKASENLAQLAALFGSMQPSAPAPVAPVMGPSGEQANALSNLVAQLRQQRLV